MQEILQRFLDIVLQADPKTVIPPYLELDRNNKSITDLSSAFPVSSIDSYHALKRYFFRLSPRDEEGVSWCSVILAQTLPFPIFMEISPSFRFNWRKYWCSVETYQVNQRVHKTKRSTSSQGKNKSSAC